MEQQYLPTTYMCIDTFNENLFEEFDHYEVYDSNKIYTNEPFQYKYDDKERTYEYIKYIIDVNDTKLYYIVASEILTEEELVLLRPYCQCSVCLTPWYNLFHYIFGHCRCCIGCLKSSFPQQHQIKKARQMVK